MSAAPLAEAQPWSPSARACWLGLGAVLLLVLSALFLSTEGMQYAAHVDEGYYQRYMARFAAQGWGALPALFREYVAQPKDWIFPNPLRLSFIAAAGLLGRVMGTSFPTLTALSMLSLVALLPLVHGFLRRRAAAEQALWTTALVGFSPLLLGLGRRALNDSFATLLMGLSCGLAFEAFHAERGRRVRAGFAAALLLSILAKESAALLGLPLLALVLVSHVEAHRPTRALLADLLWLAAPPALAVLLWIAAAGDPALVAQVARIILSSPATNDYAIRFGSGPWSRYLIDWVAVSPAVTLLAIAGAGAVLTRARRRDADMLSRFLVLLCALFLFALCLFTKNLRYAAPLEVPLRALAVMALSQWLPDQPRARWIAGSIAVALLCWLDYRAFEHLFVQRRMYDPISYKILLFLGIIPE